jgi:hypothetical protein
MLIAALLTISYENNQDAPLMMSGLRKCIMKYNGILFIHKEK